MTMPFKNGPVLGRAAPVSVEQGLRIIRRVVRRIDPDHVFKSRYFWRRRGKQLARAMSATGFERRLLSRLRSNVWG